MTTQTSSEDHAKLAQVLLAAKPLWRARGTEPFSFFCPQCRSPRKLPARPNPALPKNIATIALCSLMFTVTTWPWFGWKGIVSFIPFWALYELIHRSRIRAQIPCPHCGFDPFLYLIDVKLARRKIEEHWRKKFEEKKIPFPEPKTERVQAHQEKNADSRGKIDSNPESRDA